MSFALEFPERLDHMVLMGPAGMGNSIMQPNPQDGIRRMMKLYDEPTYENMLSMLDVFVYDPSTLTDELRDRRWASIQSNLRHLENFGKSFKLAPVHTWDIASRAGQIKHPTLVTWGRDDRFVPLDGGLRLINVVADAQLHIFSQCGHWAQWEHADRFNCLVINFLKE
jgi:pimeloyl-ACP methyl ester carboxylesterase